MQILILTGGKIDDDFALQFLDSKEYDHIIIVDGALAVWDRLKHQMTQGMQFDHLVGDFDTIEEKILNLYTHSSNIQVHRFNPEKDYTDTDIAIKLAISLANEMKGCHDIHILGATGSRVDHMLANLFMLEQIQNAGHRGVIFDSHNQIEMITGCKKIKKEELSGQYISILPVTDSISGVTLSGFKYSLNNHIVHRYESLCVSNELEKSCGFIEIKEGKALLIVSWD